jgi:hypothetical protein
MGGSYVSLPAPQRTVIDLVVLFFGADLKSEAGILRDTKLPGMARWCSERAMQLRVHPRWPEDIAQQPDEQPDDFPETPVGKIRDLVTDKDVFVFAIIGPDMPDPDVALLKLIWNTRPGHDTRVRYVFLPRPSGDAEAVRSLFAELWHGAYVYFYQDPTNLQGIPWLAEGLGLSAALPEPSRAAGREEHDLEVENFLLKLRRDEERHRRPEAATVVDENVQFTVYRPNAVQPEVWYPLLAFAHLAERRPDAPPGQPDPLAQVQALAAQALGDEAAYGGPRVEARGGVPREGQLTFVPFVEGVDFNPRSQTFEWQEDVHLQNFRLKARANTAGRVLRGQLTVYLGAFILADIDLTFRVDLAAPPPPTPTVLLATSSASPTPQPDLTPVTAVPYQNVFPSYSHKDLAIVRQAEIYGRALGHVYLRDRLALRSGEEWEVRLLELIDKADIFQLFWSSNSMKSEYVRREWEHAYALGRRGFIRPTYWEVPMPRSTNPPMPPDELAKLHFYGFYEDLNDEEFASTRAREIQLREARRRAAEEQARREAEERYGRVAEEQARQPRREAEERYRRVAEEQARQPRREAEERARRVAREAKEPERPRSRHGRIRSQPSARPRSQAPARSTRRLWLIAVIVFLVVLVAVEVVILIRG